MAKRTYTITIEIEGPEGDTLEASDHAVAMLIDGDIMRDAFMGCINAIAEEPELREGLGIEGSVDPECLVIGIELKEGA